MKLKNKKTGDAVYVDIQIPLFNNTKELGAYSVTSLKELNEHFEDYTPAEPLIKDEKIRKAVRAWAEANGFSVFEVYNRHFNYVKIHGVKDRYDPNGSNIEFMGTIAGAEKRAYEIDELCGEEEE